MLRFLPRIVLELHGAAGADDGVAVIEIPGLFFGQGSFQQRAPHVRRVGKGHLFVNGRSGSGLGGLDGELGIGEFRHVSEGNAFAQLDGSALVHFAVQEEGQLNIPVRIARGHHFIAGVAHVDHAHGARGHAEAVVLGQGAAADGGGEHLQQAGHGGFVAHNQGQLEAVVRRQQVGQRYGYVALEQRRALVQGSLGCGGGQPQGLGQFQRHGALNGAVQVVDVHQQGDIGNAGDPHLLERLGNIGFGQVGVFGFDGVIQGHAVDEGQLGIALRTGGNIRVDVAAPRVYALYDDGGILAVQGFVAFVGDAHEAHEPAFLVHLQGIKPPNDAAALGFGDGRAGFRAYAGDVAAEQVEGDGIIFLVPVIAVAFHRERKADGADFVQIGQADHFQIVLAVVALPGFHARGVGAHAVAQIAHAVEDEALQPVFQLVLRLVFDVELHGDFVRIAGIIPVGEAHFKGNQAVCHRGGLRLDAHAGGPIVTRGFRGEIGPGKVAAPVSPHGRGLLEADGGLIGGVSLIAEGHAQAFHIADVFHIVAVRPENDAGRGGSARA